jgi:hypothetical protein
VAEAAMASRTRKRDTDGGQDGGPDYKEEFDC